MKKLFYLLMASLTLVSGSVFAQVAVYTAGSNGQFGYINLTTRVYTQVSSNSFSGFQVTGMAYNTTNQTLYYNEWNGGGGTNNVTLNTVNKTTGAKTVIATINNGSGVVGDAIGLAFSSSGTLYNYNWGNDALFSINTSTAVGTQIGVSGISSDRESPVFYLGKLAFVGSTLYHAIGNNGTKGLSTINTSTGSSTFIGNGGVASTYANMIIFSSGTTLYGIQGTTLYTINTSTAALTTVGTITGTSLPTQFTAAVAGGNVPATPTITTTGTLTAFSTCSGTPSASQSFTVSGVNLTANLAVTASTGFEVSTSSGSGYSGSVSLPQSSGTVSTTTVYVRLASTATGSLSGNVTCASTGATTQNVAVSGTVTNLPTLTVGIGTSPTTCAGANGSIAFTSTNLPNGTYSLSFTSTGAGATTSPRNVTVSNNAFTLSGLRAGTYTVFSVTSNGCTGSVATSRTLTDPQAGRFSISASHKVR